MKKYIQKQFVVNYVIQTVLVLAIVPLFLTRFNVIDAITRSQVAVESAFAPHAVSHAPRVNTVPAIELTAVTADDTDTDKEEVEESTVEQSEASTSEQQAEVVQEVPASTEAPASSEAPTTPATQVQTAPATSSSDEAVAKEFIAQKESGGSYTAQNGRFYGRYQLDLSYLNGDLSPENQERVADAYVAGRYGSWVAAKEFWLIHYWY